MKIDSLSQRLTRKPEAHLLPAWRTGKQRRM